MRYVIKERPLKAYNWHRWFAWYPVRANVPGAGRGAWVWLETVERVYEYGSEGRSAFYRVIVAEKRQV